MDNNMLSNRYKISIDVLLLICYVASFGLFGNGSEVAKAVKILMLGMTVVYVLLMKRKLLNIYTGWLFVYLGYVGCSVFWSDIRDYAVSDFYSVAYAVICALCIALAVANKEKKIRLILLLLVLLPMMRWIMFIVQTGPRAIFNLRANSEGQDYNSIGQSAVYAIVSAILLMSYSDKKKMLYQLLILFNLYLIIVSGSRKCILYLLLMWACMRIFNSTNLVKTTIRLLIIALVFFVGYKLAINGIFGTGLHDLLTSLQGEGSDNSVMGRLDQNQRHWELFLKKPTFGYGIGMVEWYCRTILGQKAVVADCDYLDILVDLGFVGIVVFYGMHIYLVFKYLLNRNNWKYVDKVYFAWLIVLLVNGYICRTYFNNYFIFVYLYLIYNNISDRIKLKRINVKLR